MEPNYVPLPLLKPKAPVKTKQAEREQAPPETKTSNQSFSLDNIINKQAQAPQPTKQYYIQLASLRSEEAAREAYARIRDDFPELVEGLSVVFPSVDLGSRGTFYRIQVGPLSNSEARQRCADYTANARGGTCLVVSR